MSGVLITKGSRITIPAGGFVLTMGPDGQVTSELQLHVGYDMYPQWLRIAIEQAGLCERAANGVDAVWTDGGREEEIDALETELRAGMQACVAAAAAIDGFYGAVKDQNPLPASRVKSVNARRTARYSQITEAFRRSFKIGPKSTASIRSQLKTIFMFRDEAVHPTSSARQPLLHPRLAVFTERRLAMYSAANAVGAAGSALKLIGSLIALPKGKHAELVKYCETAKEWVYPLADAWEEERGPLFDRATL